MVTISRLHWRKGPLGIDIPMYVFPSEHNPAHFHVYAGDDEAKVSIETGEIMMGQLDAATFKEVYRWWERHKAELVDRYADRHIISIYLACS